MYMNRPRTATHGGLSHDAHPDNPDPFWRAAWAAQLVQGSGGDTYARTNHRAKVWLAMIPHALPLGRDRFGDYRVRS